MEKAAKLILEKANGRDIVIYGACADSYTTYRALYEVGIRASFFVDKNYEHMLPHQGLPVRSNAVLSRDEHFVIIPLYLYNTVMSITKDLTGICGYKPQDYLLWQEEINRDIELGGVIIGKRTPLRDPFMTYSRDIKSVGRYVSINPSVIVQGDHHMGISTSHRIPTGHIYQERGELVIGHDVWIGANVFINSSRVKSIGNGAIIGAGAVVLEDVPPYAVVVGVPAKIKKYRFTPEQIAILERVQWWYWDDDTVKANLDCFTDPGLFFERFGG